MTLAEELRSRIPCERGSACELCELWHRAANTLERYETALRDWIKARDEVEAEAIAYKSEGRSHSSAPIVRLMRAEAQARAALAGEGK